MKLRSIYCLNVKDIVVELVETQIGLIGGQSCLIALMAC